MSDLTSSNQSGRFDYDVFISYRSCMSPDKPVAETLQQVLEEFPIPMSLRKNVVSPGRWRSRLRVFRDITDLNASSDLNEELKEKLRRSRYLIVICTPNIRRSPYCTEEIRYFRTCHGDHRVLPLLVQGEPDESFPQTLVSLQPIEESSEDASDALETTRDPLAADVRADSTSEILRKLKGKGVRKTQQARFKLLAPILDCKTPDDLIQRDKARFRRQVTTYASVLLLLLLLTGFGVDQSKRRIAEGRIAEINAIVARAREMEFTEPRKAILTAVEAIRISERSGEPPLPEATQTLRRLLARDADTPIGNLAAPSAVAISQDGTWTAAGSRNGAVALWKASQRHLIEPSRDSRVITLAFSPDGEWLLVGRDDDTLRLLNAPTDNSVLLPEGGRRSDFHPKKRLIAVIGTGKVSVWAFEGRAGEVKLRRAGVAEMSDERIVETVFSSDGKHLLAVGENYSVHKWTVVPNALTNPRLIAKQSPGPYERTRMAPNGEWYVRQTPNGAELVSLLSDAPVTEFLDLVTVHTPDSNEGAGWWARWDWMAVVR